METRRAVATDERTVRTVMILAPMPKDEAYDQGWDHGNTDGYAGNAYDAYNDQIPADLDQIYRSAYRAGFESGQAAYRRTMEPNPWK
jgi:hypothetical protein